jgi:hypothetical protein
MWWWMLPLFVRHLGGVGSGFLNSVFPWCGGPSGVSRISEVLLPGDWFVSSHWSLLPIGQIATELYVHSLPDLPKWSDMFLFLLGCIWVTLQPLWLWQVSLLPNMIRQLSVVPHPQSHEIISVLCPAHPQVGFLPHPLLSDSVLCLTGPWQAEVNYVLCLWCTVLFRGCAICPPALLNYVVPWRAGDLWCSPVGIADSLWRS